MSAPSTAAGDQPLYGATPVQAVTRFFRRYVVFTGRASRSEFWWTYLFVIVVVLVLGLIGTLLGAVTETGADRIQGNTGAGVIFAPVSILLFLLAIVVPGIAIVVRRFHDAGFSGLLALLWLIPYLGGLVVLILCIMPTNPQGRRFDRDAQGWRYDGPQQGYAPVQGYAPSGYSNGGDGSGQPTAQPLDGFPGYTVRPLPVVEGSAPAAQVAREVEALGGGDRDAVQAIAERLRATIARTPDSDLLVVADGRVTVRYDAVGRVAGVDRATSRPQAADLSHALAQQLALGIDRGAVARTAQGFGASIIEEDEDVQRLVMPDADVVVGYDAAGRMVRAGVDRA